jgi:DNA polymerase III subunit chi
MRGPVEHWFYHLSRTSVLDAVAPILEKCLAKPWRVELVSPLAERLDALDSHLWTFRDDAWLPHGKAGTSHDRSQPILLAPEPTGANQPEALVLLDGAEPGSRDTIHRVMVVFDGRDEAALARARAQWRAFQAEGHALAYWQQEDGGWTRKV